MFWFVTSALCYGFYYFGGESVVADVWLKLMNYGFVELSDLDGNINTTMTAIFIAGCISAVVWFLRLFTSPSKRTRHHGGSGFIGSGGSDSFVDRSGSSSGSSSSCGDGGVGCGGD